MKFNTHHTTKSRRQIGRTLVSNRLKRELSLRRRSIGAVVTILISIGVIGTLYANEAVADYQAQKKQEVDESYRIALEHIIKEFSATDIKLEECGDDFAEEEFCAIHRQAETTEGVDSSPSPSAEYLESLIGLPRNNPGNLKYNGKFAEFKTAEEGFYALMADLEAKKAVGGMLDANNSVSEFMYVYAPPHENPTERLIRDMANKLGITRDTKIGEIETLLFAQYMVFQENNVIY